MPYVWADENGGVYEACPSGYWLTPDADTQLCMPSIPSLCMQNCCMQWFNHLQDRRRDIGPATVPIPPPAISCTHWAEGNESSPVAADIYYIVPDADTEMCSSEEDCPPKCCLPENGGRRGAPILPPPAIACAFWAMDNIIVGYILHSAGREH